MVVAVMHLYGNAKSSSLKLMLMPKLVKKIESKLKRLGLNQSKKCLKRPSRHQKTLARDW